MSVLGLVLYTLLQIYTLLLVVRMILSWIPLLARDFEPRGVVAVLFEGVYTVTDPPIRAVDRVLPPVRLGNVGLSLGFIVVFLLVSVAQNLVLRYM